MSANPNDDDEELFEGIRAGGAGSISEKQGLQPCNLMDTIKRARQAEYPINDSVSSSRRSPARIKTNFRI